MSLTRTNVCIHVYEHTFRTYVRVPRGRAAGVGREGAALGSYDGAAAGRRQGAADFPREGAAPTRRKGAAILQRTGPPQNLTFKIKFLWSCTHLEI